MFVTAVCILFLLKLKWLKNKSFYDIVGVVLFFWDLHLWFKFEERCSNISGDILDSVIYCLSVTIYDVSSFG